MKRNINILLLTLLLAFASCSFTTKTFDESDDKDKLLIQLVTYVLEQGHFDPKNMDDDFSVGVFQDYLDQLDPFKRYFYQSDFKEFEAYKFEIDDQLMNYDLTFFNLTHERLLQRMEESKAIYIKVLEKPFDYATDEEFNTEYESLGYVANKKEMEERWRIQLKFSAIANYHDLMSEQEMAMERARDVNDISDDKFVVKTENEMEVESRDATKRSLDELYNFIDDRQRKDWFSVYVNAIVEEFDPHTYYFAPEDKDRFDVAMSGNYEGIGARLQKKMDNITINEIISGGSAWRQNKLQVGDVIL
ncbi:MAG: tail-specific protease, partial [Flavobacteriaceae bacterium]|nr:tail-specific protease [Flavobacteriaceae bacterium]